jgi:hypothetical protein
MHTEVGRREGGKQAEAHREKQVRGLQVNTGKLQAVVGRQCSQAESSMDAEVYVGRKQMHSRQRHSCWGRQGETGRQALAGTHTEAWRQKLVGKGGETGSQTEASKQAGRGKQASNH